MSGIFPQQYDGGIPPVAATPNNPAQAFIHQFVQPVDTSALYYGNGCDVRLRPHVVNSLISEIAATADRAGVAYRASSLQNLEFSIRYMIQRGLPRASLFVQQNPWYFTADLDPPATHYNDFMTLTLVPQMPTGTTQNQGHVRINVNGLGYVPLLRNDGQELRMGDLLPGKPFVCSYFQGAFYYIGLVASQVPLVITGAIDFWIRTDGNDVTGDGTENSAAKAFRTINGAWFAVGSRYAGSPGAHIGLRLGIPGNYEAGRINNFGAGVSLTGDVSNRTAYRIMSNDPDPSLVAALYLTGLNSFILRGVTLVNTNAAPKANGTQLIFNSGGTNVTLDRVQFSIEAGNTQCTVISTSYGATLGVQNTLEAWNAPTDIRIVGNGATISAGLAAASGGAYAGTPFGPPPVTWAWENIHFNFAGYVATNRASIGFGNHVVHLANATGPRYSVDAGSFIFTNSQPIPGDAPGSAANFSAVT